MLTFARRLSFPLGLARARLAKRGGRLALVALGIAVGAALLTAVLGGSLVAQDRSVQRAAAALAPGDRVARAVWAGVPAGPTESWPLLDRSARAALRPIEGRPPFAAMLFREEQFGGALVDLGAIDGLSRWVRLRSGRLPRRCTLSRCEVIQVAGAGPLPSLAGLRIVRVGRGSLSSEVPLGSFVSSASYRSVLSQAQRYHRASAPPFLLAEGVRGLAGTPATAGAYRAYAWVLPIAPRDVHPWSQPRFESAVVAGRANLQAASPLFDLTAPDQELAAAASSADLGGRRLLLIGGGAAALLLAFTILAGSTLRRDVDAAWRRLTWYGARGWQLVVLSSAESAAVAAAATIAGWAAGAAVAALIAERAGSPVWDVLRHSALSAGGIGIAVGLAAIAAGVLLATLRAPIVRFGGVDFSPLDAAALGALAALGLALSRGAADVQSITSQRGTGTFLLVVPLLIMFIAAVLSARVLAPVLRGLERAGRRAPVGLRLAALSLGRNPGQAAVAVSFLVVGLGLALFAQTYRSTLARGQADQAAYAVPLDATLTEDLTRLVPLPQVATASALGALHPRLALPVLRLSAEVSRYTGSQGLTLLGVPAASLPALGGWRPDFSRLALDTLAARLRPSKDAALRGAALPPGATQFSVPIAVHGDDLSVRAELETPLGEFLGITLGQSSAGRRAVLRAAIPAQARGGHLVALLFAPTNTGLHGVANGGINVASVARGQLELGPVHADGVTVGLENWIGKGGVTLLHGGTRAELRYVVTTQLSALFRPRQPTDGAPVPVVVSPGLAGAAGRGAILPLVVTGQPLVTRIVGIAERFPTTSGDFVLADEQTVATALNADVPGSAVESELWLSGSRVDNRLRRPPFDALALTTRVQTLRALRTEPLARGALLILAAAAAAALALALLGLLLGLVSDVRDESGQLFDLETQGATVATLRLHLRLRSLLVAAFALVGGLVTGAVLSFLVVRLVVLTADSTPPQPPLRLVVQWPLLGLAVCAFAGLAAALVMVASRFKERGA